jgi:hypothetical protein
MREQLETLNYQQLLKVAREYNKAVGIPLPNNVSKTDLVGYILTHAKDVGTLLKIMAGVRAGEFDKEKGEAKGRGRPKKKKTATTETQTEMSQPKKVKKPKLKVVSEGAGSGDKRLEAEMRALEMYKKRYETNPSSALASIIKRQEDRVKMARK